MARQIAGFDGMIFFLYTSRRPDHMRCFYIVEFYSGTDQMIDSHREVSFERKDIISPSPNPQNSYKIALTPFHSQPKKPSANS